MAPRCSVVIPTYNRVELLRRTLDSLVTQRLPSSEFEVLVVDDGSTDSTALLVDNYRDRLAVRYFFQPDEGWRAGPGPQRRDHQRGSTGLCLPGLGGGGAHRLPAGAPGQPLR